MVTASLMAARRLAKRARGLGHDEAQMVIDDSSRPAVTKLANALVELQVAVRDADVAAVDLELHLLDRERGFRTMMLDDLRLANNTVAALWDRFHDLTGVSPMRYLMK